MEGRFHKYRAAVYAEIKKYFDDPECDGHCKSYEGAVEVTTYYPNYWEQDKHPTYMLTLHCYLLGPTRHYEYTGKTLDECLDKAEKDLNEWKTQ